MDRQADTDAQLEPCTSSAEVQVVEKADTPRRRGIRRRKKSFRPACRWILPRLGQLRLAGWTLRDLFGVDKCTPPWGKWGLAWSWPQADEVILENDGAICFRFYEAGRPIEQRSRPHWRKR